MNGRGAVLIGAAKIGAALCCLGVIAATGGAPSEVFGQSALQRLEQRLTQQPTQAPPLAQPEPP